MNKKYMKKCFVIGHYTHAHAETVEIKYYGLHTRSPAILYYCSAWR